MQKFPTKLHKILEAFSVAAIISTYDVLAGLIVALLCFLVRGRINLNDSILIQPKQFWKSLGISVCLDTVLIFATLTGTLTLMQPTALLSLAAFLEMLRITLLFVILIEFLRTFTLVAIWIANGVIAIRK
jgi:hypothetical protein